MLAESRHYSAYLCIAWSPLCNGGQTKSFCFLGITIDAEKMKAHLPDDKLHRICCLVSNRPQKICHKERDLICSGITAACNQNIVRSRGTFISRIYVAAADALLYLT